MNKLVPFPILSLMLAASSLALTGLSPAHLVLAVVLAVSIPRIAAPFLSPLPGIRSGGAAMRLVARVIWDIVVANIVVARLVLGPPARLQPRFLMVPLEVTHPHAITLLASIVSIVPGSVSVGFTPDGRTLLLHVLHVEDEERFIATIKARYERPLMEILRC